MNRPLTLPERPRAETLSVERIVELAKRGVLRVPQFQTGLRWDGRDVVQLFDSILSGYPVGSLLLWERQAPAERLQFGPDLVVQAEAEPKARYIVDGQQRVTALVGALGREEDEPVVDSHAVWIDLSNQAFVRPSRRADIEPHWIPMSIIGDRKRLLHWSRKTHDDELVDLAFEIEERILRYSIPAYVVEGAHEETLRRIFSRVNASGKALNETQVFQALFGDEDRPKPIERMARSLHEATQFGELNGDWLLRCVRAVAGLSTKHDFSLTSPPNDALERTEAALLRTLLFLQGEASVVHQQLLPYRMPLIVLARLFDQHPQVSPRNRQLLVRWFWRGALTGEHGNSSQGAVAAHLGDIGEDPDDSVQRLLRRQKPVGGEEAWPAVDFSKTWHARSAASRMAAVLLLQQGPRAPQSETTWNMDDARSWLGQHVLSRSFVRADGGEGASAIAGRVASLGEASSLADASPEVLFSHLISEGAAEALRAGDFGAFEAERALTMGDAFTAFTERWVDSSPDRDRPPIVAVLRSARIAGE